MAVKTNRNTRASFMREHAITQSGILAANPEGTPLRLATLFLLPAALCAQPHPVCPYFDTTHPRGPPTPQRTLARGTHQALRTASYTGVRRDSGQSYAPDTIDAYIFADLNTNGIQIARNTFVSMSPAVTSLPSPPPDDVTRTSFCADGSPWNG